MKEVSQATRIQLKSRINSPVVANAMDYLLDELRKLNIFEFIPNTRGQKKAVMFKYGTASPFSVIANNTWLLWYFRKPGLNSDLFTFQELKATFSEFEETKRKDPENREGIVRLATRDDVDEVIAFVRAQTAKYPARS